MLLRTRAHSDCQQTQKLCMIQKTSTETSKLDTRVININNNKLAIEIASHISIKFKTKERK